MKIKIFIILIFLGFSLELIARKLQDYQIYSVSLKKLYFFEGDKAKIYNKKFYQERLNYFIEWPIKIELFESDSLNPRYIFKPKIKFARKGNQYIAARPGDEVVWSTNSYGFRGAEFNTLKTDNLIRIISLGDSTTEGSQEDNQTYPFYLQKELEKFPSRYKFEVINAGHHAFGIYDILEIFRLKVLPLEPDIVILYGIANNINFGEYLSVLNCELGWPEGNCWLGNFPMWFKFFYQHSAIFRFLFKSKVYEYKDSDKITYKFNLDTPKNSKTKYIKGLEELVKLSKDKGITLILSSFATLAHKELNISHKENPLLFEEVFLRYYPLTPEEVASIYQDFNNLTKKTVEDYNVYFVDIAGQIPKEKKFFPFDYIHLSPEANQLLAKHFAQFLLDKKLIN